MSKELEVLEDIILYLNASEPKGLYCENIETIKNALERLEAIDNANPSEALNYLNIFINEMTFCLEHPKEYAKGYDKEIFYKYKYSFETTIKQALLKAQEQEKKLKALDIIKNKRVDVDYFLTIIEKYNELEKQMKVYNHLNSVYEKLTQDEFELLKKVFYEMV